MLGAIASPAGWTRSEPKQGSRAGSLVAVLCLCLLLIGGMLSATHVHSQLGPIHPDCGLCVVAHTAIQAGTPAPQVAVIQVFARLETLPKTVVPPALGVDAPLFSRPPPVDLDRA